MRPSFLLGPLMALALCAARAQQPAAQEPIFLDGADSLRSTVVGNDVVRSFLGSVRFHQGNVRISCVRAEQNMTTNLAELTGNVVIIQDSLTIKCPHCIYDPATKIARADGGVSLTDGVVTLTAETGLYNVQTRIASFHKRVRIVNDTATITSRDLEYDRTTEVAVATNDVRVVDSSAVITCAWLRNDRRAQRSTCRGNVRVAGKRDRNLLFADTVVHDHRTNYTLLPRTPLLLHVDSARTEGGAWRYDTTFVTALRMEAFRADSERYLADDSVRILRADMQARGGAARFERWRDIITLTRSPVLWTGNTQITGDSVTVFLRNDSLDHIHVDGAAFAHSPADSLHADRRDQLAGGRIELMFRLDSLRTVRVAKNAQSVYFGFEEGRAKGANRASGDTIVITMKRGHPHEVLTLGGGEGQYWPEKLVRKSVPDFRLNGYQDLEALRPRRGDFLIP